MAAHDTSSWMDLAKVVIPVAIAIGGWVFTYWLTEKNRARDNEKERLRRSSDHQKEIQEHRRDKQLERLDAQIERFYGPLYAKLASGEEVWGTFWNMYSPSHGQNSYFHPDYPNSDGELVTWRTWMTTVFQPLNREIVQVIVENAHLIDIENEETNTALAGDAKKAGYFPTVFLELIAHVKAYDGLIHGWENGDFRQHIVEKNFPQHIRQFVEKKYVELVKRRQEILEKK